jgi:hypothetical protein
MERGGGGMEMTTIRALQGNKYEEQEYKSESGSMEMSARERGEIRKRRDVEEMIERTGEDAGREINT